MIADRPDADPEKAPQVAFVNEVFRQARQLENPAERDVLFLLAGQLCSDNVTINGIADKLAACPFASGLEQLRAEEILESAFYEAKLFGP